MGGSIVPPHTLYHINLVLVTVYTGANPQGKEVNLKMHVIAFFGETNYF